jgi:hypothetical protein
MTSVVASPQGTILSMSESRFLKMDSRIEEQLWHDFHPNMIVSIQSWLIPLLLPKYAAQIEERVYVEHTEPVPTRQVFRPDVVIHTELESEVKAQPARAALAEPAILTLPMPVEQRERYVAIVSLPNRELVAVIELLSPANKRAGADGRREYLRKREQILQSAVHLVEIDLLLKGERLPTVEPLPEADYYAFVSRSEYRPAVEVYHWRRNERMPTIPIPLLREDGAVLLDLQAVYEVTYTRARYEARLA